MTDEDKKDLLMVKTPADLIFVAKRELEVMRKLPGLTIQPSGPITTGGLGSKRKNMNRFVKTIRKMQADNFKVWNILPYEPAIDRLTKILKTTDSHWIMRDFYEPIILSELIDAMAFIDGWKGSKGARFENRLGKKRGLTMIYLPPHYV
ncbi:MAG: hypothetical protein AAB432_02030 [Patescibacteria group bacterium]